MPLTDRNTGSGRPCSAQRTRVDGGIYEKREGAPGAARGDSHFSPAQLYYNGETLTKAKSLIKNF